MVLAYVVKRRCHSLLVSVSSNFIKKQNKKTKPKKKQKQKQNKQTNKKPSTQKNDFVHMLALYVKSLP